MMKPGIEMDEMVAEAMGVPRPTHHHDSMHFAVVEHESGLWYCLPQYDQGDTCQWYPITFSTNPGPAMKAFDWMSRRGIVRLTNGDGDSYDCNWLPYPLMYDKNAFIRAMDGIDAVSWEHAICLAVLVGTGKLDPKTLERVTRDDV